METNIDLIEECGARAVHTMYLIIKHTARVAEVEFKSNDREEKIVDQTLKFCWYYKFGKPEDRLRINENALQTIFGRGWESFLSHNSEKFYFFHQYLLKGCRNNRI